MRPLSLQGDASMFDFAKRDLVLWLAALAIAAALMALTANFAFDRFAAGYLEQPGGTKAAQSGSIGVPVAAVPAP
jgi:hypothetical protein